MIYRREHAGLRVIYYPDKIIAYPYLPGARRGAGYVNPDGEWVQVQRQKNIQKVEAARSRKTENLIKNAVRVCAENGGIFFTVTSGGVPGRNFPVRRLVEHMRRKYGLLYYVWVREKTKSGLPHWHFAAVFKMRGLELKNWLLSVDKETGNARIVDLSNWWSELIGGIQYGNSIRLGWAYKNGRATKYLLDKDAAGYLLKYLRKGYECRERDKTRLWTTNLDWLRPVRYNVYRLVPQVYGAKKTFAFELVARDDRYYAEIGVDVSRPGNFWHREPDVITGDASYYAKIWHIKPQRFNLRVLKKFIENEN